MPQGMRSIPRGNHALRARDVTSVYYGVTDCYADVPSLLMRTLSIQATWDDDAKVWVAESDDVPGLATEADTLEALAAKLRVIVPELLELNGVGPTDDIPFRIFAERTEHTRLDA